VKIGFTAREVMRLTGISYSTLNLWAKNGMAPPSVSRGIGSGAERIYSLLDLVSLSVALELRRSGVSTRSIKEVLHFLRTLDAAPESLLEGRLVVSGQDVILARSERELVSTLKKPGQGYLQFVVDLPNVLDPLLSALRESDSVALAIVSSPDTDSLLRKKPQAERWRPARKQSGR
jgi:DNA-binding transcriptional MerR regulator